jgi:DNA (cytosine-5)-methyltransferase 3A
LSIAKKNREGLDGAKSGLFYNAVEIWRATKPTYWIFENVASMSKESKQTISEILGVEPILINSALVSAQQRKRLFWTNITGINQPADRGIYLKDILEIDLDQKYNVSQESVDKFLVGGKPKNYKKDIEKSTTLTASMFKGYGNDGMMVVDSNKTSKLGYIGNSDSQGNRVYSDGSKSVTLSANSGGLGSKTGLYCVAQRGRPDQNGKYEQKIEARDDEKTNALTTAQKDNLVSDNYVIRKLTPVECCRLQTFPDDWNLTGIFETKKGIEELPISNTQRYKQLGNAVTVEVIKHILTHVK